MITLLVVVSLAFVWLGYETDWLTVRLLVGVEAEPGKARRWQFARYGEDALLLCQQCNNTCPNRRRYTEDRWFGQRIPTRTVKAFGSTMSFNEGCNYQRARLLKDIYKAQKSKALPGYKPTTSYGHTYDEEQEIELLVDGKSIASINGDYKRGMIKDTLKPYTTKARVGRKAFIIPVGEVDRVASK